MKRRSKRLIGEAVLDNESPPLVSASNTSASTPTDIDAAADRLTNSDNTPDDALPEDIDIQSLGDAFTRLHSSDIEPDPEEALSNRDEEESTVHPPPPLTIKINLKARRATAPSTPRKGKKRCSKTHEEPELSRPKKAKKGSEPVVVIDESGSDDEMLETPLLRDVTRTKKVKSKSTAAVKSRRTSSPASPTLASDDSAMSTPPPPPKRKPGRPPKAKVPAVAAAPAAIDMYAQMQWNARQTTGIGKRARTTTVPEFGELKGPRRITAVKPATYLAFLQLVAEMLDVFPGELRRVTWASVKTGKVAPQLPIHDESGFESLMRHLPELSKDATVHIRIFVALPERMTPAEALGLPDIRPDASIPEPETRFQHLIAGKEKIDEKVDTLIERAFVLYRPGGKKHCGEHPNSCGKTPNGLHFEITRPRAMVMASIALRQQDPEFDIPVGHSGFAPKNARDGSTSVAPVAGLSSSTTMMPDMNLMAMYMNPMMMQQMFMAQQMGGYGMLPMGGFGMPMMQQSLHQNSSPAPPATRYNMPATPLDNSDNTYQIPSFHSLSSNAYENHGYNYGPYDG